MNIIYIYFYFTHALNVFDSEYNAVYYFYLFQVSIESPRGLRAVLKHVYGSAPINEPEFYTPRPALKSGDFKSEEEKTEVEKAEEKEEQGIQ